MKNTYLLAILLAVFSATTAFCQQSCDTLYCKDGRRIPVRILRTEQDGILYHPCGNFFSAQLRIEKDAVDSIHFQKSYAEYAKKMDETDLSRPKTILWGGFSVANLPTNYFGAFYDTQLRTTFFQFGAEFGFKDIPTRIVFFAQPIAIQSGTDSYYNYKKDGTNGQIGFAVKWFTQGRLSGHVSNAYWGFDLRTGQQAYKYYDGVTQLPNRVKITWTALMPRIGLQFSYEYFAFDLALPFGFQRAHYSHLGSYNEEYKEGSFAIQPAISVGLRF